MQAEFKTLPLALIAPSLTNPRKHFDAAKLQELSTSIASSGVHQPVLVRPLPTSRLQDTFHHRQPGDPLPEFELVAGERRYRASQLAGVDTIPAMVRELVDEQVIEIQILENLQRDDLTPMEEAEGYEQLLNATGITREQLAARIGKSRTYVFNRLKLLDLHPDAKAALRAGELDASRAELIARIPDEKLQLKALKALTEKNSYNDELRHSYRSAKTWLAQNVMLRLEHAVFDIKDASLCGDKPACGDCQLRTGANPDLFADVDSPDVCTDPPCFHAKEQAHHDQVVAKARKTGIEVIEGEEAERIVRHNWIDGYEEVEEHIRDPRTGAQTPRHMLLAEFFDKAKIKAATRIIIKPNSHEPVKVITNELDDELEALLDKAAAKSKTAPKEEKARAQERVKETEEQKQHVLAKKYEDAWRTRVLQALQQPLLDGAVNAFQPEVLRAVLTQLCLADVYDYEEAIDTALSLEDDHPAISDGDALARHIQTVPDIELGNRICLYIAVKQASDIEEWAGQQRVISAAPALLSLAASAGVDAKAIQAEVQFEMREELKLDEPQKPAKGKPADAPAAPANVLPAAAAKKAKGKKAKLSASEAQSGIAAAMQGQESAATAAEGDGTQDMPRDTAPWPWPGDQAQRKAA